MSKGASTMLSRTVNAWMATMGFMIPVARRADPSAVIGNCIMSAGMNQSR